MENIKKEIGDRIRKKREQLKMSREKLCEIVDISTNFLSEIERGIKSPSALTLIKLCNGLCISADYVLFGKNEEEEEADVSEIVSFLKNIDPEYLPLAEEHLKTFIKTIGQMQSEKKDGE
ncbi:helix-turn-helix domain-containing protein [Christensenellaceae bacterium OttesenSCG-928-M15]|nr:helix-turn-helix domain-containing protein [Christensenellaceae bacterium OttesenSCG-928-M15]